MTYPKFTVTVAVGCGVLLSAGARGAESLDEVVVTATRVEKPLSTVPNTVTVIDQEELEQQLAVENDLSTVLGNLVPSFSPSRQKMTSAGESLRGRKPLYLIDGVPQSNPLRVGGRDGHTIDPFMLERVEVLHGANAIHGLGAAGGVINLITKKPAPGLEQKIRLETGFQAEDVGESADYGVSYSFSNRVDNADILAGLSYRSNGVAYDANGEVIGADNTQGDTMDADSIDGFLKTGYEWNGQRIELTLNHYDIEGNNNWISVPGDADAGIPSGAEKGDIYGEAARNRVTTASLSYSHEDFLGHSLRVQGYRQDFEATYGAEATPIATFQDPAYGPNLIDQSQNNSEKHGIKITLAKDKVAGLPVGVVYGVDVLEDKTWQALILTGRSWVPETAYLNYAPFLQLEYTGIEKLTVTGGVRHEESKLKVDDFTTLYRYGSQFVEGGSPEFSETLFNIGGTYQFTKAWRVYANYAEAFSMPDVGRVLRGINVPGQSVETFLDLEPILTENTDVGVEYRGRDFNSQLTYYMSDSDFGQRLQRGADGIYTVEREKTEIDGIEFKLDWFATDADTFGLRYAQSEGRYDSDQDGRVDSDLGGANIAPDRVNISWSRYWIDSVSTRLQLNHFRSRDFEDSDGEVVNEFDGYTTLDLSTDIQALGGQVTLAVQNLTNRDYFTYYSQTSPNDLRNFTGLGRSFNLAYQRTF